MAAPGGDRRCLDHGRYQICCRRPSARRLFRARSGWLERQSRYRHFRSRAIRRFIAAAVRDLAAEGKAAINRIMVDGRAIAAAIVLRSGRCAWFWKIAYDEAFARYSPGVMLTVELTHELLDDPSVTCAELLRDGKPLHDRSSVARAASALRPFDCGPAGAAVCAGADSGTTARVPSSRRPGTFAAASALAGAREDWRGIGHRPLTLKKCLGG